MCEHTSELLDSWVLELLREQSPRPARDALRRLGRYGVCEVHFVEALRRLLTEGRLRASDPGHVPASAAGTLNLLDLEIQGAEGGDSGEGRSRVLSGRIKILLDHKLGRGGSGR